MSGSLQSNPVTELVGQSGRVNCSAWEVTNLYRLLRVLGGNRRVHHASRTLRHLPFLSLSGEVYIFNVT
jgi:hypothetical protein